MHSEDCGLEWLTDRRVKAMWRKLGETLLKGAGGFDTSALWLMLLFLGGDAPCLDCSALCEWRCWWKPYFEVGKVCEEAGAGVGDISQNTECQEYCPNRPSPQSVENPLR